MHTETLFYNDCLLRTFSARVLSCRKAERGWEIQLDATAFYPGGGGQVCDLGTLNGVAVLDVREQDGTILHLCPTPLTQGETVTGILDWQRRFDQMQQHTGEHIVSGILHRRFGCHNVGFHVGADVVTIDFDIPIPADALEEIEAEANAAIWQDLPVICGYPSREALASLAYRSKKALPWPVRIVEIPGYDRCACCGVHTKTTGQAGFVKLFSCVKFHQGVRIEMACGGRALGILNTVYRQNKQVSQIFSAKLPETGAAAQRVWDALAEEKYKTAALQRQLFAHTAQRYAGQSFALHYAAGLTPGALRELAEAIRAVTGCAAVFTGAEGALELCIAGPQAARWGSALRQSLRVRGGGRGGFFQGRLACSREALEEFFRTQTGVIG